MCGKDSDSLCAVLQDIPLCRNHRDSMSDKERRRFHVWKDTEILCAQCYKIFLVSSHNFIFLISAFQRVSLHPHTDALSLTCRYTLFQARVCTHVVSFVLVEIL